MSPIRRFLLLSAILSLAIVAASRAAETSTEDRRVLMARLKELQIRQLHEEARRRMSDARLQPGRSRRDIDPEFLARLRGAESSRASHGGAPLLRATGAESRRRAPRGLALATNVPVSNPAGEEPGSSQNEPTIAAWGSYVLAAYNDWPTLSQLGSILGYSYSVNGGQSFVDGGMVPAPAGFVWASDPVISVNEKTGEFYFVGLFEDTLETAPQNGVGMVRGTFAGTTFHWDTPRVVRQVFDAQHVLDKPWIAADSLSGNLYVTFTDFFPASSTESTNDITYVRSRNKGAAWDAGIVMNGLLSNGNVQGARPAVGPAGEVYVVWKEIGPAVPGYDFLKIRKSVDGGVVFAPETTITTCFDNYGTGAPGFNRERGVTLPSIAVDRSTGANRGRVYVSWHESLNWFDDALPIGAPANETEFNDFFALSNPFTIGQTLYGTFRDAADYDSWSFQALQDTSYIFWADSVTLSTYRLRIFCSDSLTRLAFTGELGTIDASGNPSVMVWTAPSTGTYYVDMNNAIIDGGTVGSYRIRTAVARHDAERGRDQRDVFVSSSANGAGWSNPVRVNQDPPHFDDWLPEVSATSEGDVYALWYDWRDAPPAACGGFSNIYLALSQDGAGSFNELGSLTDQATNWTQVASNLVPNQGDYLGLYTNETAIYAAWSDGRLGTPDIYSGVVSLLPPELRVTGIGTAVGGHASLQWQFEQPHVVDAVIYRRSGTSRDSLRQVFSDGNGQITFVDSTVSQGSQYIYNLAVLTGTGSRRLVGDVSVTIPSTRLGVRPNPMARNGIISFAVPDPGGAVKVVIHDITGRRVRVLLNENRSAGSYEVTWDGRDDDHRLVNAGLYLVRVTAVGDTKSSRITLIP